MLIEYSNTMHMYQSKVQTKDIERAYKVWARVSNMRFYSNNIDIWEIKIENIQRVKEDCLRTQVWKRETAFVEKLEMS